MHIVLDLDDTLIESFPTYVRLHRQVARELGLREPAEADLVPYAATWEETLAALWPGADLGAFVRRYDELADRHPYPAMAGATRALAQLRDDGHRLWILTKRTARRLDMRLRDAGLDRAWFDDIFTLEGQPAPKPDPRCFEPFFARAGRDAPALYVGDRAEDHAAAVGAGLTFVAVRSGPEARAGFPQGLDGRFVIDSVADLPAWLANGYHRPRP